MCIDFIDCVKDILVIKNFGVYFRTIRAYTFMNSQVFNHFLWSNHIYIYIYILF